MWCIAHSITTWSLLIFNYIQKRRPEVVWSLNVKRAGFAYEVIQNSRNSKFMTFTLTYNTRSEENKTALHAQFTHFFFFVGLSSFVHKFVPIQQQIFARIEKLALTWFRSSWLTAFLVKRVKPPQFTTIVMQLLADCVNFDSMELGSNFIVEAG